MLLWLHSGFIQKSSHQHSKHLPYHYDPSKKISRTDNTDLRLELWSSPSVHIRSYMIWDDSISAAAFNSSFLSHQIKTNWEVFHCVDKMLWFRHRVSTTALKPVEVTHSSSRFSVIFCRKTLNPDGHLVNKYTNCPPTHCTLLTYRSTSRKMCRRHTRTAQEQPQEHTKELKGPTWPLNAPTLAELHQMCRKTTIHVVLLAWLLFLILITVCTVHTVKLDTLTIALVKSSRHIQPKSYVRQIKKAL